MCRDLALFSLVLMPNYTTQLIINCGYSSKVKQEEKTKTKTENKSKSIIKRKVSLFFKYRVVHLSTECVLSREVFGNV